MTYLIIILLLLCNAHFLIRVRDLRIESAKLELQRVRFLEVSRWCAFIDCNPVDVEYFMDYKLTWRMAKWELCEHRDPLIIQNFRDYCLSRAAQGDKP